jgi:trigger factor
MVLQLLKETKFALPDEFLKRWLTTTGEKKASKEEVEKEYPNYSDGLRWQLIENKVIREHEIKVSEDELKNGVRQQLLQQFAHYGINQADNEMMDEMVEKFMKREDEVRKVMEFFKGQATLKEKETSSEKFYEMLSKENIQ